LWGAILKRAVIVAKNSELYAYSRSVGITLGKTNEKDISGKSVFLKKIHPSSQCFFFLGGVTFSMHFLKLIIKSEIIIRFLIVSYMLTYFIK
jgi:hypothetical protein